MSSDDPITPRHVILADAANSVKGRPLPDLMESWHAARAVEPKWFEAGSFQTPE
jgi:hypothetical protein